MYILKDGNILANLFTYGCNLPKTANLLISLFTYQPFLISRMLTKCNFHAFKLPLSQNQRRTSQFMFVTCSIIV